MGASVREDGSDLSSDVLVSLRVRGRVFCRSKFRAPWSLGTLARQVGLSRSTFVALFSKEVGVPPLAYLERWRLDLAASLLRSGHVGLEELADRVGYALTTCRSQP